MTKELKRLEGKKRHSLKKSGETVGDDKNSHLCTLKIVIL